jgi:hypothetical protein
MNRGDHREPNFRDASDRRCFPDMLCCITTHETPMRTVPRHNSASGHDNTIDRHLSGIYHTHGEFTDRNGDGIDDYDSENFSPADRNYAGRFGVPIYLRTPSCQFKKYNPASGNTTILLP